LLCQTAELQAERLTQDDKMTSSVENVDKLSSELNGVGGAAAAELSHNDYLSTSNVVQLEGNGSCFRVTLL